MVSPRRLNPYSSKASTMDLYVDDIIAVHQTLEFNCTAYDFPTAPPNVTTHLEALGVLGMGIGIGGAASTVLLIIIFIVTTIMNVINSPVAWRRLLAWIISMPMVISIMALVTFVVPRAGGICDIVKQSYMPFMLMHFIDLAVLIEGGEEGVLASLERDKTPLSLCTPPCCFFGLCGLTKPFTKKRFRMFRGLVYQAPLWQFILNVTALILQVADLQLLVPHETANAIFQAIAVLNILVFSFGNWGFNVLIKAFKGPLKSEWNRSIKKGSALSIFISILKLQNFVLVIVDSVGYIPCIPPSHSVYNMKMIIDAALTLAESLIFGIVFGFVFRVKKRDIELTADGKSPYEDDALIQPMSRYWTISSNSPSQ